jgi:uncharacterized protein
MKNNFILISLFIMMISSCGQNNDINKKVSRISDLEDILTTNQEKYLDAIISKYQRKTANEIMILTSKDIGMYETAIQYAVNFGDEHGIFNKGKHNGLVIFVSKNLELTSLATGYGTDKSLQDEMSRQIVDSCMIPLFSEEKYFDGIKAAIEESIKNWN